MRIFLICLLKIIISFIPAVAATQKADSDSIIIITGTLPPKSVIHISTFNDTYTENKVLYFKSVNENGFFKFITTATKPFFANLNNKSIYIKPGDSIVVRSDASNNYFFDGSRHAELNFFNDFEATFGHMYTDPFETVYENKLLAYFKQVKADYNSHLSYVEEYSTRHNISADIKYIAQKEIYYKFIKGLLTPIVLKSNGKIQVEIPKSYSTYLADSIGKSAFEADDLLNSRIYTNALIYYNYFLCDGQEIKNREALFSSLYNSSRSNFKNKSRDFLTFAVLQGSYKKGLLNYDSLHTDYVKNTREDLYRITIDSLYQIEKKKTAIVKEEKYLKDGLITTLKSTSTWEKLLKDHKNKVIYIDFWASWCKPCIAELPALQKLEKEFRGKPVAFISISIDSKYSNWINALKKHVVKAENIPIQETFNHFLISNVNNSTLYKGLNITTIPRYLLIDKAGNIYATDAMAPRDPYLKYELSLLLDR